MCFLKIGRGPSGASSKVVHCCPVQPSADGSNKAFENRGTTNPVLEIPPSNPTLRGLTQSRSLQASPTSTSEFHIELLKSRFERNSSRLWLLHAIGSVGVRHPDPGSIPGKTSHPRVVLFLSPPPSLVFSPAFPSIFPKVPSFQSYLCASCKQRQRHIRCSPLKQYRCRSRRGV